MEETCSRCNEEGIIYMGRSYCSNWRCVNSYTDIREFLTQFNIRCSPMLDWWKQNSPEAGF